MTADPKHAVLVVDDTEINIDILVETLADEYEVSVALDGKSALEIVEDSPPDLILLDIMMPEMDGYEVCGILKENERFREIPVIFVTAKGQVADEIRGFEVGAVDYITKPISPPVVRARVKTHLELKEARETLTRQNRELMEASALREDVDRIARHDLKAPLNAVIGYPRILLSSESLSEKGIDYLNMIEASGYRMLNMINQSLDIFKMERGIYALNPTSVDILGLIRAICNEMRTPLREKSLTVRTLLFGRETDEGMHFYVLGEELLCYSMLANLLKNALEASPPGECLTISIDEERRAVIRIHNRGAIPVSVRHRFFEKYVTCGTSGTGLGTYSAKLIAEVQNGGIEMDTSEASGTTITVFLPSITPPVQPESAPSAEVSPKADPSLSVSPPEIHVDIREILGDISQIISLLASLSDSLKDGDTAAEGYGADIGKMLAGTPLEGTVQILTKQISCYDFGDALETLSQIRNALDL